MESGITVGPDFPFLHGCCQATRALVFLLQEFIATTIFPVNHSSSALVTHSSVAFAEYFGWQWRRRDTVSVHFIFNFISMLAAVIVYADASTSPPHIGTQT